LKPIHAWTHHEAPSGLANTAGSIQAWRVHRESSIPGRPQGPSRGSPPVRRSTGTTSMMRSRRFSRHWRRAFMLRSREPHRKQVGPRRALSHSSATAFSLTDELSGIGENGENAPSEANFDEIMSILKAQELIQVTPNSGARSGLDNGPAQPEEGSTSVSFQPMHIAHSVDSA